MGKKTPVYLNIYDFTSHNSCLGVLGIAGYHTGVELNGKEFCYFVCDSDLGQTGVTIIEPESADFLFTRKLYLGQTGFTGSKIQVIIQELAQRYTVGKYHLFRNNCNHFSDQLATILLGKGIPKEIFNLTNILRFLCFCLPTGLVSGQWALEMLERENQKQQASQLKQHTSDTASEK